MPPSSPPFEHVAELPTTPILVNPLALANPGSEPVSDLLYSGFVEHLGRGIYGGIVDNPSDPSPPDLLIAQDGDGPKKGRLGWRKDLVKILAKDGELEMPMLRWPGGNFVSSYLWKDGIGPIEDRPVRSELAWLSRETNKFGTDEFIDYCRELGVEPYFCLNMGTGTYAEALEWVEYCNGRGDTYWANLRRKHTGRDEPHNVKLWGLGNEMHGSWQVGRLSAKDYVEKASRWAMGLRLIDPEIRLVACGNTGNSDWDREVLAGLIDVVDYHSIHLYTMLNHQQQSEDEGWEFEKNVMGPAAAEHGISIASSLIDLAKIERDHQRRTWEKPVIARNVKIAYDEWHVWDDAKARPDGDKALNQGLEQAYDFTDALGVAAWLNVLVRKSKDVGLACIAQSVNVISPVMTSPTGLLFQPNYFPLRLFARYMKNGHLLQLSFSSPVYKGPTFPSWARYTISPAYVDTVGIICRPDPASKRASIRISVLNRHPSLDFRGGLEFLGFKIDSVEKHELYSDDLTAINTFENPDVVVPTVTRIEGSQWDGKALVFRKHSWTFLLCEGSLA